MQTCRIIVNARGTQVNRLLHIFKEKHFCGCQQKCWEMRLGEIRKAVKHCCWPRISKGAENAWVCFHILNAFS